MLVQLHTSNSVYSYRTEYTIKRVLFYPREFDGVYIFQLLVVVVNHLEREYEFSVVLHSTQYYLFVCSVVLSSRVCF